MINIARAILRLSLILIFVGAGLGVLGMVLAGVSIYLRLQPVSTEAVASTNCESCSPSGYVIRQLPPLDEATPARSDPSPAATAAVDGQDRVSPEVEPSPPVQPPDEPAPTRTPGFLTLGDALGETPTAEAWPDEPGLEAAIAATSVVTTVDRLPVNVVRDVLPASTAISEADEGEANVGEIDPTGEELDDVEPDTSTDQVEPPPVGAEETAAQKVEIAALSSTSALGCPAGSEAGFELIPIEGRPLKDHPGAVHGDLNLVLRGYIPAHDALEFVDYEGNMDADPPQLAGLFEPNRTARISSGYRVNDWIWDSGQCGGHPRGCPGPPAETFWPITLVGLATTPGEAIYTPERGAQIYSGGYVAMVLYAEERRITLGYTRRDSVAAGYVVHLEDICVNPNLTALYQAQLDGAGWNDTGRLPALRNNQPLGIAPGAEIKVAVRDAGSFMDPRSRKDWWR